MAQPVPALTCVLIFIAAPFSTLAIGIDGRADAGSDACFDFHGFSLSVTLAVWVHRSATASFNFGFDLHVSSPINRSDP